MSAQGNFNKLKMLQKVLNDTPPASAGGAGWLWWLDIDTVVDPAQVCYSSRHGQSSALTSADCATSALQACPRNLLDVKDSLHMVPCRRCSWSSMGATTSCCGASGNWWRLATYKVPAMGPDLHKEYRGVLLHVTEDRVYCQRETFLCVNAACACLRPNHPDMP